jgi:hypothetical protein
MNFHLSARLVLALLAALVAGCTTTKDEPRTVVTPPTGSSGGSGTELALDTDTAQQGATPTLAFGAPCRPTDTVHCGTKGRVAVMVAMRNGVPSKRKDVPCELLDLNGETAMDRGQGCVKDDRVYLIADCPMCRQASEWDMTGIVAEMTDGQLLDAQQRVGLAVEPKLRTVESWRTALATKAGKRRR